MATQSEETFFFVSVICGHHIYTVNQYGYHVWENIYMYMYQYTLKWGTTMTSTLYPLWDKEESSTMYLPTEARWFVIGAVA